MKNIKVLLVVMLSGIFTAGCISMNQQRSILRSAADNTVTAALDKKDSESEAESFQAGIKLVATQVKSFLESNNVLDLTKDELTSKLTAIVPTEYSSYLNDLIGAVSPWQLNLGGAIGENNVKRLVAVCDGAINGAEKYSLDDRNKTTEGSDTNGK